MYTMNNNQGKVIIKLKLNYLIIIIVFSINSMLFIFSFKLVFMRNCEFFIRTILRKKKESMKEKGNEKNKSKKKKNKSNKGQTLSIALC